jgi:hypothetical protein
MSATVDDAAPQTTKTTEQVVNQQLEVAPTSSAEWGRKIASWSPEERAEKEKKFLRKIDLHLLPILIVMYIMNYIDRNALPQARIQGLEEDIGLVGSEYNIVLSVTFIGYILMQVPSNMMLGLFRPSWYLSAVMIAWGIVSGCTGAVHSFGGLAATRFFLGVTEYVLFLDVLTLRTPIANDYIELRSLQVSPSCSRDGIQERNSACDSVSSFAEPCCLVPLAAYLQLVLLLLSRTTDWNHGAG